MDYRHFLTELARGATPSEEDLVDFVAGLTDGLVTDAQGAAFAMGVCRGCLGKAETVALTRAMRDSGRVLRWDLSGPVLDKHSTGGLGDGTSLVVAPILAALGAYAPMISGRGLGHTGGTLDKLEAIRGVSTEVDIRRLRKIVRDIGCAAVSATAEIAPADRRLYALRDHTGTVASLPLIVASILSKKLAAGTDAIVFDVKEGSGAFMRTRSEAEGLASALVAATRGLGVRARALITDMSQPLAPAVGNAVEMVEVLAVLRDPVADSRFVTVTVALAGSLLALGDIAETSAEGERMALRALRDGRAAERFEAMVRSLGGPADLFDMPERHLPSAPLQVDVPAGAVGKIQAIDGVALGELVVRMGGGRQRPVDGIDPRVGLSHIASLGDAVTPDTPVARIHAADEAMASAASLAARAAFRIGDDAELPPLIHQLIE